MTRMYDYLHCHHDIEQSLSASFYSRSSTVKIPVHHTGRGQLYGITTASQGTFEVRVDTGHFDSNFSSTCQAKRSYPDRGLST
jgi:hypothetical protein